MKRNKDKNKNAFDSDLNSSEQEDTEKYTTDDDDLLEEEKKLLKGKKRSKLVTVFELLGKPGDYLNNNNGSVDKSKYVNLLALLEKRYVIVHFNNDYSLKEKYDFIVNEVFNQYVESDRNKSNKVFVYEDYHPEKYSSLEDDEEII